MPSLKKKSLLCLYPKKPGGEYIATKNICQRLQKNSQLKTLAWEIKDYRYVMPGGKLRVLRNFIFNSFIFLKALKNIERQLEREIDYLYSPSIYLLFFSCFFAGFAKTKFIYHFHGFEYGESGKNILVKYLYLLPFLSFVSLLEWYTLRRVWKIFVPAEYSASLLLKRYPFLDKKKISIIPNGYDEKIFYPSQKISEDNVKHQKQVLYVGRLVREKGIKELIKAFEFLDKKKYQLTILYLSSEDLDFENEVKRRIAGSNNIAVFKNLSLEEIGEFYRKSDLTVLPSKTYFEQLPLVYLESLACGTPMLISNKIPGILAWQKKIAASLILSKITPKEIAFAIKEFCQLKDKGKEAIRQRCLDFAKSFTWDESVKVFLNRIFDNK